MSIFTIHNLWGRRKKRHTLANILSTTSSSVSPNQQMVEQPTRAKKQNAEQEEQIITRDLHQLANAEKMINMGLAMASASLGFAILGAVVYPPLALLSIPYPLLTVYHLLASSSQSLKKGKPGVNLMVGVTVLSCVFMHYYIAASLSGFTFALSRKLMLNIKDKSQKEFIDVFQQQSKSAWLVTDGGAVEVALDQLQKGDIIVVHTGEMVPVDGMITHGIASLDQRLLTGEAQPSEKEVGDEVFASTIVLAGEIQVEVKRSGTETTVAQIGEILNDTMNIKTNLQLRAEELADRTVIPFLAAGAITLPVLGPMAAIAVINSHIGYRMSVVAPIGIFSFLKILSQQGILVKEGHVLDKLSEIDTVVFDKTGTLTLEQPHVCAIHPCGTYHEDELLAYAATAEGKQRHPIALAIVAEARARNISLFPIDEAQYEIGYGLKVVIGGVLIQIGSNRFMDKEGVGIPATICAIQEDCHQQGHSLVMVAVNGELAGAIELQPTIRPESKEMIQTLRQKGIQATYIISGDHETPTRRLATELGIDHYYAETLPQDKAALIEQLQAEGKKICYIGDGINDSIALAKAEVSISLSGASTVAQDTAQIILLNGGLSELGDLFDIAKEYDKNMKTNFLSVLVPCALSIGGVYFAHFGVLTTIIVKQLGFATGITSALSPLRSHHDDLVVRHNSKSANSKSTQLHSE